MLNNDRAWRNSIFYEIIYYKYISRRPSRTSKNHCSEFQEFRNPNLDFIIFQISKLTETFTLVIVPFNQDLRDAKPTLTIEK